MRLGFVAAFLALFAGVLARWSNQDYEIFDVDRNLKLAEGVNTTFYSFLDVKAGATTDEISKAYRRRSLQLHPDKNPGVAGAQTRFERLGLIAKMLRTPEVRERYDHFYHNGFPTWKGTGYYYSRYRPGLGLVLAFVMLVVSGFHYLGMVISARSHRSRIQGHIEDARAAAGYPGLQKCKRIVTETGRIFQVEPTGEVYLCGNAGGGGGGGGGGGNGQEVLLDVGQVPAASFSRSLIVRIPRVLFRKTVGRFVFPTGDAVEQDPLDDAESSTTPRPSNVNKAASPGDGGRKNKKRQ